LTGGHSHADEPVCVAQYGSHCNKAVSCGRYWQLCPSSRSRTLWVARCRGRVLRLRRRRRGCGNVTYFAAIPYAVDTQ